MSAFELAVLTLYTVGPGPFVAVMAFLMLRRLEHRTDHAVRRDPSCDCLPKLPPRAIATYRRR